MPEASLADAFGLFSEVQIAGSMILSQHLNRVVASTVVDQLPQSAVLQGKIDHK
jgi:hypothetical protein